jgi:hypothetical protein
MRQLSPLTNLLLACLSALGLVAALGLPWYAPGLAASDPSAGLSDGQGPMEQFAERLARTFTDGSAMTGADALGASRTLLSLVAFAVIVLSLAMLVPAVRPYARDVLRTIAIVAPISVVYLAFDTPGAAAHLEIRWGLLVGVAAAAFMATSAWHGSSIRVKRRPAPARSGAAA